MIGFLKKHFVSRNGYEYQLDRIYHNLEKHSETIEGLQHQIDQLSATISYLRKEQLIRRETERGASRLVKKASKNTTTKPKAKK